jgi:glutaminase
MNYQPIINGVYQQVKSEENVGKVASYIPELGTVSPEKFGVHLTTVKGEYFAVGDSEEKFSIQSIAKVISLSLAYKMEGSKVWDRVGVEPSGTAFNSLVQLEHDRGIPRNPLINAGAIVICDLLVSLLEHPRQRLIEYIREISGNSDIDYCPTIAQSEKSTGFRNAALINFIKSFGNIHNNIETVLDFYYHLCSIKMSCRELAQTFLFLANNGKEIIRQTEILNGSQTKRINAIMQTCGFYDEAGEFTYKVGLPGKSGVGGGIIAVHPNKYVIAVWSPRLNEKGNSYRGMKFLEGFTTETASSIF